MFRRTLIDSIRVLSPTRETWVSRPAGELPGNVTVEFKTGQKGILDMKNPRAVHWGDIIDRLEKSNQPVYVEIDDESGVITDLLIPMVFKVERLDPDEHGNLLIRLQPSAAIHALLKSDPNFERMRTSLEAALKDGSERLITETRDDHEIIDVRQPPETAAGVPGEEKIPPEDPPVDEAVAQETYENMNAESCDPCNPSTSCIPFLFPDDGCWIRAHIMCHLMRGPDDTNPLLDPEKVWIRASAGHRLDPLTPNHPDCHLPWGWGWHVAPTLSVGTPEVNEKRVIDPSLSPAPESELAWKNRQRDPGATLTDTLWTSYNWETDTTPVSLALAHQKMQVYREALKDRCLQFGPPPYSCTKALFFIIDRNTFSDYEIEAMLPTATPAVIASAFYIVLDGFSPDELGFTSATMQYTPALHPSQNIPGMTITPVALKFEDSTHLHRRQRLTWVYDISFTGTSGFTSDLITVTLQATMSSQSGTGYLYLIRQPNPYEIDGETSWLSTDLRVFQIKNGESRFGVPINNNPSAFITQVISNLNSGNTGGQTFEADISTDQQVSQLELSEKIGNIPVYNFAVAKVRYLSLVAPATDVRVFFRIFTTATTSLEYNPATTYRRYEQGGAAIPLLGITNNEISAIPCFAAPRIDSASASLTTQTDNPNVMTIPADAGGTMVVRYFGCWLDFNQTHPQYPIQPAPVDGPFPANRKSIQELIRNNHQCLVSEIFFTPSLAQNNSTPSTSDKLAQRNLAIVESANPGLVSSRRIPQTFEIRPSASKQVCDELMIDWGNLPEGSHATIFLPGVDINEILRIAGRTYRSRRFARIDENTVRCDTGSITYLPLPFIQSGVQGMLTIDLPEGIKKGQVFTVVVRQVTGESRRVVEPTVTMGTRPVLRHIAGSFQITIPVRDKSEILAKEERLLSNLRWIERAIPEDNRWAPAFGKYVSQTADRVDALGGNAKIVAASPSGNWMQAYRKCRILGGGTALLTAIVLIDMGIPAAVLTLFTGIPLFALLIGTAYLWIKNCRPTRCRLLLNLLAGTAVSSLVLAILILSGITAGLQTVLAFLISAVLAVVLAVGGGKNRCFGN